MVSDPDLPGPDLPEPRFTGMINFPRYGKITVLYPDIPGTPIYRAKSFPPSIPVNRGPTVYVMISCKPKLHISLSKAVEDLKRKTALPIIGMDVSLSLSFFFPRKTTFLSITQPFLDQFAESWARWKEDIETFQMSPRK
eukprot:sb/3474370/